MNGQGAMCRVLVRAGACLAQENKDGISIFNYQVIYCCIFFVTLEIVFEQTLVQFDRDMFWNESMQVDS